MEIWIWPCPLFSSYEGFVQSRGGWFEVSTFTFTSFLCQQRAASLRKLGAAAGHAAGSGQADVAHISGRLGREHRERVLEPLATGLSSVAEFEFVSTLWLH